MVVAFLYRRSFLFFCALVFIYCIFAWFYNPLDIASRAWHSDSVASAADRWRHPHVAPGGGIASDGQQHGAGPPVPQSDDKDYEADIAPAKLLDGSYPFAATDETTASSSTSTATAESSTSDSSEVTPTLTSTPSHDETASPSSASSSAISASTSTSSAWKEPERTMHTFPLLEGDPFINPCSKLPGAEDVYVAMKTGESEIRAKLPIHFNTTFVCAHHYGIFSDVAREMNGQQVHDVISSIPEDVRKGKVEFEYYDNLQRLYREGVTDYSPLREGVAMKEENPAWVLDKWKFLPIMEKAYDLKPDAKWYVFMEADTALVWWNLLGWMTKFDSSKQHYLGGQTYINNAEFAHGGAGYVLSQAALAKLVTELRADPRRYQRVEQECCGDLAVAVALKDLAGQRLLTSWPIMQGETPTTLDYTPHHWCHPAVTYHHMNDTQTRELWDLEQSWQQTFRLTGPATSPLLHRDVFARLVEPHIHADRDGWDNLSADVELDASTTETDADAHRSPDDCRAACRRRPDCVQWSWAAATCRLASAPRLGDAQPALTPEADRMRAGWDAARVGQLRDELAGCEPVWITERDG